MTFYIFRPANPEESSTTIEADDLQAAVKMVEIRLRDGGKRLLPISETDDRPPSIVALSADGNPKRSPQKMKFEQAFILIDRPPTAAGSNHIAGTDEAAPKDVALVTSGHVPKPN